MKIHDEFSAQKAVEGYRQEEGERCYAEDAAEAASADPQDQAVAEPEGARYL